MWWASCPADKMLLARSGRPPAAQLHAGRRQRRARQHQQVGGLEGMNLRPAMHLLIMEELVSW